MWTLLQITIRSTSGPMILWFSWPMGFKAINTGCPTLWRFTEEFCKSIPKVKAKNVVCSVSGHIPQRDIKKDKQMIECLKSNYDKIYVWIQTAIDEEYFKTLTNQDKGTTMLLAGRYFGCSSACVV